MRYSIPVSTFFAVIVLIGLPDNITHALAAGKTNADAALPEIIFAARAVHREGHWYANFSYYASGEKSKAYGQFGQLCRFDPTTGKLTILLDDAKGTVRDPQVHYDGKKILFSYRKGGRDNFDLYEIDIDGANLRQLTDDQWDDFEPTCLPDGDIAFVSSRCKRWVPCYITQVATLHRCDKSGKNIRPISGNVEHDNHPWVLGDGRIVYTRWEYTDRSMMHYHGLWVMNPDGTGQMTLFGNMHPGGLFIDAKPIPNSGDILFISSPGHGQMEHKGALAVLDPSGGPDSKARVRIISKGDYRDPYPLSSKLFLAARANELLLIDVDGKSKTLYKLPKAPDRKTVWLNEPRPLRARRRERIISSQVDRSKKTGTMIVMNAYKGRNMAGVKPGAIKKLLLLENLPIPTAFSGGMEPISWGGTYFINRILGTVPVELDGSVHADIPAGKAIQLVALDENDFSIKRMHSFFSVMPGERASCIGCHENRSTTSIANAGGAKALARPASKITPVPDNPDIFDYPRDIQPIWDKHCLKCHDVDKRKGGLLLTGDQGPMYTHSYFMLSSRLQMADGRNLARSNYPPYRMGSSASYLIDKISGSHNKVKLSQSEIRRVKLWIDASAPFAGTYAALGSGMFGGEMPVGTGKRWLVREAKWPSTRATKAVIKKRCASCHKGRTKLPSSVSDNMGMRIHHLTFYGHKSEFTWTPPWMRRKNEHRPGSLQWAKKSLDPENYFSHNILYNLSRPEKSVLLMAPLSKKAGGYDACKAPVFSSAEDPDYQTILESIRDARDELNRITRFNMPNFKPPASYIRQMQRYGVLPATCKPGDVIDPYATDRKYWRSLSK